MRTTLRRSWLPGIFLLLTAGGVADVSIDQQPPRDTFNPLKGTGRIRGSVTADTGMPLRRATVRLSGQGGPTLSTLTDANGQYEFVDLPAARFTLLVTKPGYVQMPFGWLPGRVGHRIELAAGQRLAGADIRMARGGVVTGRVFDEFGDPIPEAYVQVYRMLYVQGVRRLGAVRGASANDIGQYRVYGLPPGNYYISGIVRVADMPGPFDERFPPKPVAAGGRDFAPTFFPGVLSPTDARPVAVDAGQEIANLDFTLQAVRLLRVSGTVVDSRGRPAAGMIVLLNSARPDSVVIGGVSMAAASAEGRFTISGIAPGDYRIDARSKTSLEAIGRGEAGVGTSQHDGAPEYASLPLTIADDIDGLLVTTSRGQSISGRLSLDGAVPDERMLKKIQIATYDAGAGGSVSGVMLSTSAPVQPDLTFEARNVLGTRVVRVTGLPEGWALASVRADGIDVTDSGIEVRGADVTGVEVMVTAKPAGVAGVVTDALGKPAGNRAIIVFPDDRSRRTGYMNRYVVTVPVGEDGTFKVAALPPATYLAAVVEAADDEWLAPENLDRLSATATKFVLGAGEIKSLAFTVK